MTDKQERIILGNNYLCFYVGDSFRAPDWVAAFKKLSWDSIKFLPRSPVNAS